MKDGVSFRAGNGINGEASPSSTSRLNNQLNFSCGPSSYPSRMPRIAEMENGNMGDGSQQDQGLGNASNSHCISNFPNDSWDISSFNDLKRGRNNDGNKFSNSTALETQVAFALFFSVNSLLNSFLLARLLACPISNVILL